MNFEDSKDSVSVFDINTYGQPQNEKVRYFRYNDFGKGFEKYLLDGEIISTSDKHYEKYIEEQKVRINKLVKETIFTFGKYRGGTLAEGLQKVPEYCKWVAFDVSGNARAEARILEAYFYFNGEKAQLEIEEEGNGFSNSNSGQNRKFQKGSRGPLKPSWGSNR